MPGRTAASAALALLALAGGCRRDAAVSPPAAPSPPRGTVAVVLDTIVVDERDAGGTAEPVRSATLASRLMATVRTVAAVEGARVRRGELLVQLDARELDARRTQLEATRQQMEAGYQEAAAQARRIRALFADSAATRMQLEQSEAVLARATAGVTAARGALTELDATASYAAIRAPFDGIIVRRHVDPGALAVPGAPLLTIEDESTLRITVSATPAEAHTLRPGTRLAAMLTDTVVTATVEGIVAAEANRHVINALVTNLRGHLQSRTAATLRLPLGRRSALLVPTAAVVREGDLRAVRAPGGALRWVTIGREFGTRTEVLGGLAAGDTVLVPPGGER